MPDTPALDPRGHRGRAGSRSWRGSPPRLPCWWRRWSAGPPSCSARAGRGTRASRWCRPPRVAGPRAAGRCGPVDRRPTPRTPGSWPGGGGRLPGAAGHVPNVANAAKVTGAAGVAAHRGGIAWYRTTLTAPRTGSLALRFESVNHAPRSARRPGSGPTPASPPVRVHVEPPRGPGAPARRHGRLPLPGAREARRAAPDVVQLSRHQPRGHDPPAADGPTSTRRRCARDSQPPRHPKRDRRRDASWCTTAADSARTLQGRGTLRQPRAGPDLVFPKVRVGGGEHAPGLDAGGDQDPACGRQGPHRSTRSISPWWARARG